VSTVERTWELWAYRYANGQLLHIGDRWWVELHQLQSPLVPVLIEEVSGDPYAPEVTHYGWRYAEGLLQHEDVPTMIQIRLKTDPSDSKHARALLDMCFSHGCDVAIARGDGNVVPLRITERKHKENPPSE
jgi:hypothetical protein